jgi:hypothetical protein
MHLFNLSKESAYASFQLVCSFAAVAWPAAALSGPRPQRGRPAGRLAELRKNALMLSLLASTKSSLQLNDIIISDN